MINHSRNPPTETAGRDRYYDAALADIVLQCQECSTTLDPDVDLGPDLNFHSPGYFILLGDEAFRRGWLVEGKAEHEGNPFELLILCPECRSRASGGRFEPPA